MQKKAQPNRVFGTALMTVLFVLFILILLYIRQRLGTDIMVVVALAWILARIMYLEMKQEVTELLNDDEK